MFFRYLFLSLLTLATLKPAQAKEARDYEEAEASLESWGIHNNCINLQQIKRVNVRSDEVVFIELSGGRKVMMNFKNTCRGLKYNGYIHSTRTNNLCAKFDTIRVINRGTTCMIESFIPVEELDNQPVEE